MFQILSVRGNQDCAGALPPGRHHQVRELHQQVWGQGRGQGQREATLQDLKSQAGEIQFRARVNTFKTEVVVRSENEELVEYCSLLYLVGLPQLPACAAGSQCDSRVSQGLQEDHNKMRSDLLQRLVFRTSF